MTKIEGAAFRQIMGCFATGIAVVTAHKAEMGDFGLTVNSLTSLSLEPPLLLFCLDKAAHLHDPFRGATHFAINLLSAGQEAVSRHFADRHHNPAPEKMWDAPQQGCPVLQGTLGWVLCKPYAHHPGGDHTIFVGEVIDLRKHAAGEPLLYFHGRYREIAPKTP
jgi:flavin reductase (DIM6/NTAB) family NADH-FMN oxidoreductase RutF